MANDACPAVAKLVVAASVAVAAVAAAAVAAAAAAGIAAACAASLAVAAGWCRCCSGGLEQQVAGFPLRGRSSEAQCCSSAGVRLASEEVRVPTALR